MVRVYKWLLSLFPCLNFKKSTACDCSVSTMQPHIEIYSNWSMIELAPNIPTSRTVSEHMSLGHTQSDFNGEKIGGNFILTQMLNWSQWMVELVVFVRANWHLTIKSLISWLGAVILWHFLLFHGSRSNDHANQCSEKKMAKELNV